MLIVGSFSLAPREECPDGGYFIATNLERKMCLRSSSLQQKEEDKRNAETLEKNKSKSSKFENLPNKYIDQGKFGVN